MQQTLALASKHFAQRPKLSRRDQTCLLATNLLHSDQYFRTAIKLYFHNPKLLHSDQLFLLATKVFPRRPNYSVQRPKLAKAMLYYQTFPSGDQNLCTINRVLAAATKLFVSYQSSVLSDQNIDFSIKVMFVLAKVNGLHANHELRNQNDQT